jgi:hypothetical protein
VITECLRLSDGIATILLAADLVVVCASVLLRFLSNAPVEWHVDLWNAGPNKNANWHCACVIAWEFWNTPSDEAPLLRLLQARRCGQTGKRLWKDAEVDHRIPLFRVRAEHRHNPWPKLLEFWGLPNLQVINRDAHAAKSALEARDRRAAHSLETALT